MNYELRIMNRGTRRNKKNSSHDSAASLRRGFSLVELLVSIAIFLVITSITLVNQNRFSGNILITNLAYDVALGIRQAQVYGIGEKQNILGAFNGYGVHFSHNNYFILFADTNADGIYNTDSNNDAGCISGRECVSFFKLSQGNLITRFCATKGGITNCTDNGDIDGLDILFNRPDPEPDITAFRQGSIIEDYSSASIMVTSPQNVSRSVSVLGSGQISVQ